MVVVRPSFRGDGGGGVVARLPGWLRTALARQFDDLLDLLVASDAEPPVAEPAAEPTAQDPDGLDGLLDEPPAPWARPDDPVLLRLRPDGYDAQVEDGGAAADFRRFTQTDLAALQRQRLSAARAAVSHADRFELDAEQTQELLGALNDVRLALGIRLEVSEDPGAAPGKYDPRAHPYELYLLLGHVQHQLLVALGAPDDY